MSRNTDSLISRQKEKLIKLRSNLKDILTPECTDKQLIKWLRVGNFNIKEAEKIFRVNYYNRIFFQINGIENFYVRPEVVQLYEPGSVLGFAKDGSVIRYYAAGQFDVFGFVNSMSCCDLCLYFSYLVEADLQAVKEENQKTGRDVHEITFIMDLEGFHIQQVLHKCVIEMGLDFARLYQEIFPEIWSNILVVNAPMLFDKAFNIFKPAFRSSLLDCIKMAGKESSKALLLEYIDEDVLPAFLGGKRTDSNGDPYCKEFVSFGGKVKEKFYSCNSRIPLSPTDPDIESVTIGPRGIYNHPLVVKEGGHKFRYQHRFENGSLYISFLHKEFEKDSEIGQLPASNEYIDVDDENCKYKQVTVLIRAQGHCCQEDAILFFQYPGIYVLRYSNAGNWFTSRKVLFRFTMITPDSKSS